MLESIFKSVMKQTIRNTLDLKQIKELAMLKETLCVSLLCKEKKYFDNIDHEKTTNKKKFLEDSGAFQRDSTEHQKKLVNL